MFEGGYTCSESRPAGSPATQRVRSALTWKTYQIPRRTLRNAFDVERRFEASWGRGPSLLESEVSGSTSLPDRVNAGSLEPPRERVVQVEQGAPAEGDGLSGRHGPPALDTPSKNPPKRVQGNRARIPGLSQRPAIPGRGLSVDFAPVAYAQHKQGDFLVLDLTDKPIIACAVLPHVGET